MTNETQTLAHTFMGPNDVDPGHCEVCDLDRDLPYSELIPCVAWEFDRFDMVNVPNSHLWVYDSVINATVCALCETAVWSNSGPLAPRNAICLSAPRTVWQ